MILAGVLVVAFRHPDPVLAAMLLACGVIAVVRFPILALGVLLLVAPFQFAIVAALGSKAHISIGPFTYWKDALVVALFVRAAVGRFWSDRRSLQLDVGDSVLIVYVLVWILIATVSPSRPGVGPALGRYVEGPLLLLTIKFLAPNREEIWRLASAMIAAATIIGGAGLIEWIGPRAKFQRWYGASPPPSGQPFKIGANGYRSGSFIYDPLIFAFYVAAAAPFALAATFVRTRWRMAAAFGAVACGAGLVVTFSRSGYIGGGVGVLAAIALAARKPGIRVSLIGLIIVISSATFLYYFAAGSQTLNRSGSDRAHRSAIGRDVDLVVAKPFGYGLGTTDRSVYKTPSAGQLGYSESVYLSTALEGGIPGLLLYLTVLFMTTMRVRAARRRAIRAGDRSGIALASGALGAMLAVMLAGLFLGIHELVIDLLLWGAPGLALAWPVLDHRERPETSA